MTLALLRASSCFLAVHQVTSRRIRGVRPSRPQTDPSYRKCSPLLVVRAHPRPACTPTMPPPQDARETAPTGTRSPAALVPLPPTAPPTGTRSRTYTRGARRPPPSPPSPSRSTAAVHPRATPAPPPTTHRRCRSRACRCAGNASPLALCAHVPASPPLSEAPRALHQRCRG